MNLDINNSKIQLEVNGKIVDCSILFTFDSEDTFKSYVGYTDNSVACNGRKNIFVSAYNPLNPNLELENVTDKKELMMIQEVLQQLDQEANS